MFVNAAFAPQPAIPATVIYKERPALMQVNPKQIARELLTKKQYSCFTKLIGKESAWKSSAKNPKSSAKGIGQLLDSTYRNLGMKHSEAGVPQVVATLAYIGRKYGSGGPCAAWKHFQRHNWY
jgi:SLT domain-containing protein